MTSLERVQSVLAGRLPDRVPVCLHNFLHAADEAGVPMERYRTDPQAIAKAHLDALDKYGHDCLLIDLDTTMLAEAMGAPSECAPNEPGRITGPAIESLEQVSQLSPIAPERDGRVPALLEAIRLLAREVGGQVAIRGNCDQGPFSLAALLRGIESFMMDLATDADNPGIEQLLRVCYESHLATHRAVMEVSWFSVNWNFGCVAAGGRSWVITLSELGLWERRRVLHFRSWNDCTVSGQGSHPAAARNWLQGPGKPAHPCPVFPSPVSRLHLVLRQRRVPLSSGKGRSRTAGQGIAALAGSALALETMRVDTCPMLRSGCW